MKYLPQIGIW